MGESQKPIGNLQSEKLHIEVHTALRALIHPHSKPDFNRLQACLPHLFPADTVLSADGVRSIINRALDKMNIGYPDIFTLIKERFWEGWTMQDLSLNQG